jgi:hypothetical protein
MTNAQKNAAQISHIQNIIKKYQNALQIESNKKDRSVDHERSIIARIIDLSDQIELLFKE